MPTDLPNNREAILLSCLINGEMYGRQLREEYQKRSGRKMPIGSLYTTMDRIIAKGYVKARMGESTHERGGNRRKYFKITGAGNRALSAWEMMAANVRGVATDA